MKLLRRSLPRAQVKIREAYLKLADAVPKGHSLVLSVILFNFLVDHYRNIFALNLDEGTDIRFIQELLGHNDMKTTLRYTHVSTRDLGRIENPQDTMI